MARERHVFGRAPLPVFIDEADRELLETDEGRRVLARVRSVLCDDSAVDLDDHAARVAVDALKAKAFPRTRFAAPTLDLGRVLGDERFAAARPAVGTGHLGSG